MKAIAIIYTLLIGLCVLFLVGVVRADVSLEINYHTPMDPALEVNMRQAIPEVKAVYTFDNNIRTWASYERNEIGYISRASFDVDIIGVGFGYEHKFNKTFSTYFDGGLYFPFLDERDDVDEDLHYLSGSLLPWDDIKNRRWNEYDAEIDMGIGATAGVKIRPSENFALHVGTRVAKFDFKYEGSGGVTTGVIKHPDAYWSINNEVVFWSVFLGASYSF